MKYFKILLIITVLVFSIKSWSQISGQLYQDGYPYPMVKVYFEDIKPKASSDFDGNFNLKIPADTIPNTLVFSYSGINLHITNCPLEDSEKLSLGKIILPKHKQITVEEYKQLKRKERKQCLPLYQGSTVIGYKNKTQLEDIKIQLHCKEGTGISNFIFNKKQNYFSTSWNSFLQCE